MILVASCWKVNFFDRGFASNEGNEISNIVQLQEAVDGRSKLVEYGLLPPRSVRYGLKFFEGGGNLVFNKVKCTGDHAEGR